MNIVDTLSKLKEKIIFLYGQKIYCRKDNDPSYLINWISEWD